MASIGISGAWPSSPRGRALASCGLGAVVAVGLALGFLAGSHLSPCNPRNLERCGRPLSSTLLGLDALAAATEAAGKETAGSEEAAAALCPPLAEAVNCYFWFSERCLPPREQHFYSKVYVEASAAVQGLCRADGGPPLLERHAACLRTARLRRSECNRRFLERLGQQGGGEDVGDAAPAPAADSLIDSLYDVDAKGTFQAPLCRALGDYILCGLQLVRDSCGISVALRVQDLHDNLTSLVFSTKCDASMRPVLPGPADGLHPADMMTATPGTFMYILTSLMAFLIPICIVIVKRMYCKK